MCVYPTENTGAHTPTMVKALNATITSANAEAAAITKKKILENET